MLIEDTPKTPTTLSASSLSSTNSITNLAQSSMFWKPTFMTESDWLEHIPFAFWLIEAHKPTTLLEIGTTTGVSYFAMCQAVDRLHLDSSCFAIGQWNEATPNTNPGDTNFKTLHSHNRAHYSSFSNLLTNSRTQALQHFDDGSIDLIHIQGLKGHDTDRQLINSWIQKLSENGLLLLHGTNIREADTQLYRLFTDLKQSYPGFEFRQSKGLGVLGIGHHQADLINILFSDAESRGKNQVVQDVFSRLGRACADSYAARVNEEHTDKLDAESQLLKIELESAERNLQQTRQLLEANRVEMKALETHISQRVEMQALERGQLVERSNMIQEMYAQLKSDAVAKDLQTSDLENKLIESTHLLAELKADKLDSEARIESSRSEIVGLKQTLSEKISEIEQNKIERNKLTAQFSEKLTSLETLCELEQSRNAEAEQKIEALQQSLDERSRKSANNPEHDRLVADLQAKLKEKENSLAARFIEIAKLTNLLESSENKSKTKVNPRASKSRNAETLRDALQSSPNHTRKVRLRTLAIAGKHARLVEQSELFDATWYLARYADVGASEKARKNPARHYVLYGGFEARDPSELFNSSWYLHQNPDVMKQGINPLIHYLLHGKNEGRLPKPSRF